MTGTQSIDRAAQLLVLVVEGDGAASVGELAERSGLPKSTVSRAISALERRGLLQRDGVRRGVRPGPVLLGLARCLHCGGEPLTTAELARQRGDLPPPAGRGPTSWQL